MSKSRSVLAAAVLAVGLAACTSGDATPGQVTVSGSSAPATTVTFSSTTTSAEDAAALRADEVLRALRFRGGKVPPLFPSRREVGKQDL